LDPRLCHLPSSRNLSPGVKSWQILTFFIHRFPIVV
jgi:hypothetical protein